MTINTISDHSGTRNTASLCSSHKGMSFFSGFILTSLFIVCPTAGAIATGVIGLGLAGLALEAKLTQKKTEGVAIKKLSPEPQNHSPAAIPAESQPTELKLVKSGSLADFPANSTPEPSKVPSPSLLNSSMKGEEVLSTLRREAPAGIADSPVSPMTEKHSDAAVFVVPEETFLTDSEIAKLRLKVAEKARSYVGRVDWAESTRSSIINTNGQFSALKIILLERNECDILDKLFNIRNLYESFRKKYNLLQTNQLIPKDDRMTMNCWEFCFLVFLASGVITHKDLRELYDRAQNFSREIHVICNKEMPEQFPGGYSEDDAKKIAPDAQPEPGDLLMNHPIFTTHVGLCTGSQEVVDLLIGCRQRPIDPIEFSYFLPLRSVIKNIRAALEKTPQRGSFFNSDHQQDYLKLEGFKRVREKFRIQ